MGDRYRNFAELEKHEKNGVDYRILICKRDTNVCILAPHGGGIEPATSKIATKIAADRFTLYCFEGVKGNSNSDLHITSTNFDEPRALSILAGHSIVIVIHGLHGKSEFIKIGGLDTDLRNIMISSLNSVGFNGEAAKDGVCEGASKDNICNRGRRGKGVQLEISRALRDRLISEEYRMNVFSKCVRECIINFKTRI